ncbi:MAG: DnaJ domain-containing protein [Alphaproteobacteria bacterium GM202ARS2]|nr:DnaJ domain-containing protein [Alphaproteobacteria bacterium GM202ARS2]
MTRYKGHNGNSTPPTPPLCDHDGCTQYGTYLAPKHPPEQGHYHLCLEHVRQYNKNWNFFASMSSSDIERYRRRDRVGHRPTWRHGFHPLHRHLLFSIFYKGSESHGGASPPVHSEETRRALSLLQLQEPVTLAALKKRYHSLVKRYHPDARGGNTDGESMLRAVNEAYWHLKKHLKPEEFKHADSAQS